jgi:phosphoenolpyruvate-protein phosphotransferase (PTS system enzyme I)
MAEVLKGIGVASGIAIGRAVLWSGETFRPQTNSAGEPQEELARLASAIDETLKHLRGMMEQVAARAGEQEARMFKTHIALINDPMLMGQVKENVQKHHLCAEEAVERAVASLVEKFEALKDSYLRERAVDVKDVGQHLLRNLTQLCAEEVCITDESIICASDLSPSEASLFDPQQVLGIITEKGSATSHASILARALNIPTVVGVKDALTRAQRGDAIIVDGRRGEVIVRPDAETLEFYRRRQAEERSAKERLAAAKDLPAVTADGCRIEVAANIGGAADVCEALSAGAEGIGLLRTEFLFLQRETLPSEDEQFEAYKEILSRAAPRRVIARTLDVGGDKALPAFDLPREGNPFLGLRGIRLSLAREEIFHAHLRALLRASRFGNLSIMLPMVSDIAEVQQTRALIDRIRRELVAAGEGVAKAIPLGIMVETPAAVLMAEELAEEVDFFSIGTNDLTQYLLAVDRLNEGVDYLYQPFHPAVLRAICGVVQAASRKGIRVGVCGETAAEPMMVPLLVGLGVDELSVAPNSIPLVKNIIRRARKDEASRLAERVLRLRSAEEVRAQLESFAFEMAAKG